MCVLSRLAKKGALSKKDRRIAEVDVWSVIFDEGIREADEPHRAGGDGKAPVLGNHYTRLQDPSLGERERASLCLNNRPQCGFCVLREVL